MARDGLSRGEAIALVQRIMDGDYTDDGEVSGWLHSLQRELVCPHVSDLIFWPEVPLTAAEVVERASAYRPIAPRPT